MKSQKSDSSGVALSPEKRWENPYKSLVELYPNRIFSIEDAAQCRRAKESILGWNRPALIEVGSGSGNHLIQTAERYPEHLLVGIEIRYKRAVRTIEKAAAQNVENLIVLRGRVQDIAQYLESDLIIEGCFVNFPDPWPKRRNERKRLLTNGLMDAVGRWIVVGGFLSVKTDQLGYFREFCEEVESIEAFSLEVKSEDWHNNPLSENSIRSEFECLFASKGQPICHALLRRGAI